MPVRAVPGPPERRRVEGLGGRREPSAPLPGLEPSCLRRRADLLKEGFHGAGSRSAGAAAGAS